jgi:hypothetical protein
LRVTGIGSVHAANLRNMNENMCVNIGHNTCYCST